MVQPSSCRTRCPKPCTLSRTTAPWAKWADEGVGHPLTVRLAPFPLRSGATKMPHVDTLVGARRLLAAQAPAVIVAVVGLLAAAYVPLFVVVGGLGPQVFGFPGADVITSLAFAAMGFLIARRYPRNPLGWIMLAVAVLV